MIKFNIIIIILSIIYYNIKHIDCQIVCDRFLNVNFATKLNPCGENADQPCQTIQEAVTGCGKYDIINLNFKNGTYQIETNGSFNQITNKTINMINSDIATSPSIIIDLSITTTTFIDIAATTKYDFTAININGFTFQSISNIGVSIIYNNNSVLNSTIENCNFVNSVIGSNGLISLYGQTTSNANNSILSVTNSFININNCQFNNIFSPDVNTNGRNGGLIYSESSSQFTISNCNFTNISIDKTIEGGILDLEFGSLSISGGQVFNSSFKSAFYIASPYPTLNSLIQFSNVSFISNSNGIGILVTSLLYKLNIQDSRFVNNNNFQSISIVGVLDFMSSTISNCFFALNNNTNSDYSLTYYQGSSISVFSSNVNITGCTFNGNRANYGSALYAIDGINSINTPSKISISNCTFIDNHSLRQGGSIYIDSIGSLNITNSEFDDNVAPSGPSLFCKSNSNVIIKNVTSINEYDENTIDCTSDNSNCKFVGSDPKYSKLCQSTNDGDNNNHNKLTPGQITGIVVGCVGAFIVIIIISIYIARKVKKSKQYKPIGL